MFKRLKKKKAEKPIQNSVQRDGQTTGLPSSSIHSSLDKNRKALQKLFIDCDDVHYHSFFKDDTDFLLVYIEGMTKQNDLNQFILEPLLNQTSDVNRTEKETFMNSLKHKLPSVETEIVHSFDEAVKAMYRGNAVLFVDGHPKSLKINMAGWAKRQIEESKNEPTIRGPKEGFTETLSDNLAMIRRRIQSHQLKMKTFTLGKYTRTQVVLTYIESIADPGIVKEATSRIKRIDVDSILESGYIEEFIEDDFYSPFPQVETTERGDVVVAGLLEGRIAVIVDGTPTALIVPISLFSLLQAPDDYYHRYLFSSTIRVLRYVLFLLTLTLPALYVAVMTFHQEMIPSIIVRSIAGSREAIPFPTLVEALVMQLAYEALYEAGLRLPRQVGSAVTIVGALVIGEAAVTAGFVSAPIVIIIALTGIASFSFPRYSLEMAVRQIRPFLIILGGVLGLLGVIFGLLGVAIHLCSLRSFGLPYLSPLAPFEASGLQDTFVRAPHWKTVNRPLLTGTKNIQRKAPNQQPGPPKGDEEK